MSEMKERSHQPNFEIRKLLYSHLKEGDLVSIDGKPRTVRYVDNPHFPYYIYTIDDGGASIAVAIEDIENGKVQFAEQKPSGKLQGNEQVSKSELSADIIAIIDGTSHLPEDYDDAWRLNRSIHGGGLPHNAVIERMAKIITSTKRDEHARRAVGDNVNNAMWLYTEALIQIERGVAPGSSEANKIKPDGATDFFERIMRARSK